MYSGADRFEDKWLIEVSQKEWSSKWLYVRIVRGVWIGYVF